MAEGLSPLPTKIHISCLAVLGFALLLATSAAAAPGRHKGELYFHWGYNWSVYSESDIHFEGPGYKFTLNEVTAHDRQSAFKASTYLNPAKMTVPQYDARIGYFFGERTSVSFGVSHLKYVVTQLQGTTISGFIDESASSQYAGDYDNDLIRLDYDFLMYEHTDGLNYGNLEIETMVPIWEKDSLTQGLYATVGVGAGIVTPKTDVTLLGGERSDRFHLAGYGLNTKVGLKYEFLKRFFLQYFISVGWMNLTDIPTRGGGLDSAEQSLFYLEHAMVGGMTVYTF